MRPAVLSVGPFIAGSATKFAASQAPTIGTPLVLTGTEPDKPRRVLITAGNDAVTTRTMTIVGTNWQGDAISEVLAIATGASANVSALDYATITSMTPTGVGWVANVEAGTVTSGTNAPVGSSPWFRFDDYAHAQANLGVDVTGVVNYTVEYSDDDPNLMLPQIAVPPANMQWTPDAILVAQTTSMQGTLAACPLWARLTLNSATATSGSAVLNVKQAGGNVV